MAQHGLNKETAWRISIGIEKKIYTVQPELSCEYRNHVKGIIRIVKVTNISFIERERNREFVLI